MPGPRGSDPRCLSPGTDEWSELTCETATWRLSPGAPALLSSPGGRGWPPRAGDGGQCEDRHTHRIGRAEGGGAGTVSALGQALAEARPSPRLRGQASTRCPETVSLHWPSRREARLDSLLTQGMLGFVLDRFPPNYLRATPTPLITQFFFFLNGTLTYI